MNLTAFASHDLLARGPVSEVVRLAKAHIDGGGGERIAIFDETGHAIDIDFRGSADEVVARLANHPLLAAPVAPTNEKRGPGRPKLGVVSREISLLPRHWDWLASQRGGASGTLRRLVDEARRKDEGPSRARAAAEAAHRFMWELAGDFPGFEEASRALWAGDYEALRRWVRDWPTDVREHLMSMLAA